MEDINKETDDLKNEFVKTKSHQPNLSSLSAFSHVPLEKRICKETSYFYQQGKEENITTYDSIFKRPQGYNEKLHRDDREHAKHNGLDIYKEESSRPIGVLSSSQYGRYLERHQDVINREHARVGLVRLEFYRRNGISRSVEEGYGCVIPS